jgi:hypothetical protein
MAVKGFLEVAINHFWNAVMSITLRILLLAILLWMIGGYATALPTYPSGHEFVRFSPIVFLIWGGCLWELLRPLFCKKPPESEYRRA